MIVAVAGETGVLAIVREWQVHAIVTGEIQIDSDSVLDNRHRSPICSAVPDIEDVFAGKVLSEEAAFHPPLVAAGGLGPDVPHRLPHSSNSGRQARVENLTAWRHRQRAQFDERLKRPPVRDRDNGWSCTSDPRDARSWSVALR